MPQSPAGLGLPLMDHLVEKCPGGPGPPIAPQVSMREGDLRSLARTGGGPELPQPPSHPAGHPEIGRPETPPEVSGIELGVDVPEPLECGRILRPSDIDGPPSRPVRGHVGVHREGHQDSLSHPPVGATDPRPGPPRDGSHHLVGGRLIPAVDPERAPASHADEHATIGVEDHRNRFGKSVRAEPDREQLGHAGLIRP